MKGQLTNALNASRSGLDNGQADGHAGAEAVGPELRRARIEGSMGLVVTIARRYLGRGLAIDDLISEGTLGLIYAVDRYDPSRGVKFSSFAGSMIQHSIVHAIGEAGGMVRLPPKARRIAVRWARAGHKHAITNGTPADPMMLALELGIPPHMAEQVYRIHASRWGNGSEMSELGLEGTNGNGWQSYEASTAETLGRLRDAMESLGPVRAAVVRLHFGLSGAKQLSMREVAREVGLTAARARQELEAALVTLRRSVAGSGEPRGGGHRNGRSR